MTNLTNAIVESGGSRTLLNKLQELEQQEADVISQIAKLEEIKDPDLDQDSRELSRRIIQVLDDPDRQQIKELLRNLIQKIEVLREGKIIRGVVYYYSSVNMYVSVDRYDVIYSHKMKCKIGS